MNSIKHRFTLDMHSTQSQISIPALLGDTSRSLHINFSDGGSPYFIETGCLAKISIIRPTGTHIEEFCEIVNNSTAVYHFEQNENTCAVEGIHECDITLYGLDGERIASPRFSMVVSERVIRSDDFDVTDEDRSAVDAMLTAEAQRQANEISRQEAEAERKEKFQQILNSVKPTILTEITLLASAWVGTESPYSQVVEVSGVSEYSKVDILPSVEQLAVFHNKDLAFVTENDEGVVTVYAIGDKPQNDYTIQALITEVTE